jgi:aryl-alcohol dehydrogenase-like predicted oxidoreductase
MEYRKLGKSPLMISQIGFGTMSLELNQSKSETLILRAIDGGVNYFDTADIYNDGLNESFLGRVLQNRRENLILATKVGNKKRTDGSGLDWVPSKKYILSAVDQSLKRLQTDYIDLYQLHGGTIDDPIDDIIEAFDYLKKVGKIREYGISSIRPNVIREYARRSSIVSVMMQYSLLDRRPEESMLPLLLEKGLGVIARGVLAKGLLISKPADSYLNYSAYQVAKTIRLTKEISSTFGNALVVPIKFVLSNSAISSALIGIRMQEQLKSILDAYNANSLKESEMKTIKDCLPINYYDSNR